MLAEHKKHFTTVSKPCDVDIILYNAVMTYYTQIKWEEKGEKRKKKNAAIILYNVHIDVKKKKKKEEKKRKRKRRAKEKCVLNHSSCHLRHPGPPSFCPWLYLMQPDSWFGWSKVWQRGSNWIRK